MTQPEPVSSAAQFVTASPDSVWAAFMDPSILVQWLPPAEMTGRIHTFEGRVGGGYVMSLDYPADTVGAPGKTGEHEDRVTVTFTALEPPWRIVEAVRFQSDDPALQGEMTIDIRMEPAPGGTVVCMDFFNLPPGLRPEDNDEGARLSLTQLARRFEP